MNDKSDEEEGGANSQREFSTRCIHDKHLQDLATEPGAPPIYQSAAFGLDSAEQAAKIMSFEQDEHVYSRISNPTNDMVEDRLADLSSGVAALATSSGMAAFELTTQMLASTGDNIVAATPVFENTYMHLEHMVSRRGIEGRLVPALNYDEYHDVIDESTAFLHLDTIGNPNLVVPDIERVADIAHSYGVPLVVDNTLASPALARPAEHGADIVWESTTKWIQGHGATVGGVLVDAGSFPWAEYPEKFVEIGGSNPAYDDMNFAEEFGDAAFAKAARFRGVRDLGNQQSPFDAWLTYQGLETLSVRMDKHCENAQTVAEFLDEHELVEWVLYPGLASHDTHEEASTYLDGGYGGTLSFGLQGGYESGKRVIESTEIIEFLMNLGDTRSMVVHPASSTHKDFSEEALAATGVTSDMVRLAVGLEDPEDVITDLDQAIRTAVEAC